MKSKYYIILAILLISLISSIVLSVKPTPPICEKGCDVVQTSKYAQTFGIKNSIIGAVIFAFMSFITYSHIKKPARIKRKIIFLSLILGAIIAIYFLYIQIFLLHSYCTYCLVVDISVILGAIIAFFWRR